ncbi:MAG TPA: SigB/SigF/SigG family RNA polymerase sigma factor [Solirubrobacteraceae bacterium]|nr:SigB/SigF/SigG family RNA polymerase sigma factor [Solirubrobacteraceae bacterium]
MTRAEAALKQARTRELFVRWRNLRDQAARDALVEQFLPLARKLARMYAGAEPYDDLVQVASLGLVKAIDRYDPERQPTFSAFAVPTILGELKRYFRDCGWAVHVPRRVQEQALRVRDAEQHITAGTGRAPSVGQLAEYLELSVEEVLDGLEATAAHHALSVDAPISDGGGDGGRDVRTLAETVGEDDQGYDLVDAGLTVAAAVQQLRERDRMVILMHAGTEMTQKQIAARIGVSQMQISHILRDTRKQLRELIDPMPAPSDGAGDSRAQSRATPTDGIDRASSQLRATQG